MNDSSRRASRRSCYMPLLPVRRRPAMQSEQGAWPPLRRNLAFGRFPTVANLSQHNRPNALLIGPAGCVSA